eukprot:jgi/Chlat1/3749/Chrsp259S03891
MKLRHKLREDSPQLEVHEKKPGKHGDKSQKDEGGARVEPASAATKKKPSTSTRQQRAEEEEQPAAVAKRVSKQHSSTDSVEQPPQEARVSSKPTKAKLVEAKSAPKRKALETEKPTREASPEPELRNRKPPAKQPKQEVEEKKDGDHPLSQLLPKLKLKSKKLVTGSDNQLQEPALEALLDARGEAETKPANKKRKAADSSPPPSPPPLKRPSKPSAKAASAEPSAPHRPSQPAKGGSTKASNQDHIKKSKGEDFAQELQRCQDVLKQTMAAPEAAPFNEPVDPVGMGIPDYFDVVKEPMDLSTVDKNLRQGVYRSPLEVLEHVHKVWSNCAIYNNPYDPIMELCKGAQKKFNKFWSKAGLPTEASVPEPSTSKTVAGKDTSSKKEKVVASKSKGGDMDSCKAPKPELNEDANKASKPGRLKGEEEAETAGMDEKKNKTKKEEGGEREGITGLEDEVKASGSKSKSSKENKDKGGSDKEKSKSKPKPSPPPLPKPEPVPIQPPQKVKIRIQTPAEIEKARKKKRGDEERVSKSWAVGTAHHKVDCRCIVCEQLEATEPDEVPLGEDGQLLSSDQIMIEVSGKEAAAWVEAMRKNLGRTTEHVKEMEARVAAGEAIIVPGGPRLERKPMFRKPLTPEERAARLMQTEGRTRRGAGDSSPTGGPDDDEFLEVIEVQMQSPRGRPVPPGFKLPPKAASTEVLELSKFWLGGPFQRLGQTTLKPLQAATAISPRDDTQHTEAAILSWLGLSVPALASSSAQPAGASVKQPSAPPQPGMVYDNVACCWRQPAKGSGTVACL